MTRPQIVDDEQELLQIIAQLGTAAETEVQAKTLKPLNELRRQLNHLEQEGMVRRRAGYFGPAGDALELTQEGYKGVRR